jgi:hypothetical protein
MARFLVGLLVSSLSTLALGGCSFILVDRAPPHSRWPTESPPQQGSCTAAPVGPVIDALLALTSGALLIYLSQPASSPRHDGLPPQALVFPVLLGTAGSSVFGFAATSTCRTYLAGPPYQP